MKFGLTLFKWALVGMLATGIAACSTKVTRLESGEVHDLSGAWNDTDSRLVSEEMVNDMLNGPWLQRFRQGNARLPTIIVGDIRNLSHEHINVETFVADIERVLINSGRVEFVASREERGSVREERADQDIHASEQTRNPMGREVGANLMLQGTINTIIDASGKTQVRYYQVDMTLISMADNRKLWLGQKKIKKLVERSKLRF